MRVIKYAFSTNTTTLGLNVFIVAAKRTPIGSFMGKLSNFTAPDLGGIAIRGALQSINLNPKQVNQVILGNVLAAGQGQAPARQASIKGGIGIEVPCTTINKVCSSGLKSLVFASQSIALGHTNCVIAGGFQSMSNAPFLCSGARKGFGVGDKKLLDSILTDGLTDVYNNISMGLCAEKTVHDFKITRQQQDHFCKLSYQRAIQSQKQGILRQQIIPITIKTKIGQQQIKQDQQPKKYNQAKISHLPPVFSKNGTITAANSSKINDGASAVILMNQQKIKQLNIKPLAKIISYADAQTQPIDFAIAPHFAVQNLLKKTGIKLQNIDYFQLNQAFAVASIVNIKLLDLPQQKVNIYGGAVALGHPIGMSGSRIVQCILSAFKNKGGKYGLISICNGGGGATTMLIQNML